MYFPSYYVVSPTGVSLIAKLKEENKLAKLQIQNLEHRVNYLQQANLDLKKDKDFLHSKFGEKPGKIQSTHHHSHTAHTLKTIAHRNTLLRCRIFF